MINVLGSIENDGFVEKPFSQWHNDQNVMAFYFYILVGCLPICILNSLWVLL